ncbi:MAG: hypothetical protein ABJB73_09460 [Candidatus Nitrosocosmicus sp.]
MYKRFSSFFNIKNNGWPRYLPNSSAADKPANPPPIIATSKISL